MARTVGKQPDEILLAEAALLLRKHPAKVFALLTRGALRGRRADTRGWLITRSSLEAFQARRSPSRPRPAA